MCEDLALTNLILFLTYIFFLKFWLGSTSTLETGRAFSLDEDLASHIQHLTTEVKNSSISLSHLYLKFPLIVSLTSDREKNLKNLTECLNREEKKFLKFKAEEHYVTFMFDFYVCFFFFCRAMHRLRMTQKKSGKCKHLPLHWEQLSSVITSLRQWEDSLVLKSMTFPYKEG